MSTETAKLVACVIVSTMLDFCNSVLVRMSEANLNKLERVYALARVVPGMPAYSRDHDFSSHPLHWLAIRARVSFMISKQPSFLAKLMEDAVPSRTLRSSICHQGWESKKLLVTGARAFRHTTAKMWNSLADNVRLADSLESFKSHLKTHFYGLSYC